MKNNNDMKNKNFDNEIKKCSEMLCSCRCPMDDSTLDKEIRRAIWDDSPHYISDNKPVAPRRRRWYIPASVAACLAAVLVPARLHSAQSDAIRTVKFDGQRVVFACNDGCTLENTLGSFNDFVKEKNL